jgi:hypothetical protein
MDNQNKIDYIVENIGAINKTLEFQAKQLEEHIKRTNMLEDRLKPIEDHVKFIQGLMRLIAYCATIAGLILSFIQVIKGAK